jgi:hypothetical protein
MVTVEDVRSLAMTLPRTTEAVVARRVKFRVGRIVYLAFSRDETVMGFAFPKEERDWLVGGDPDKFMLPSGGDLRYHWVLVRLASIDRAEMRELVLDAWRMVVPKRVADAYQLPPPPPPPPPPENPPPPEEPPNEKPLLLPPEPGTGAGIVAMLLDM